MSSIIVRGMDKPESCGKCFFRDGIFCKAKNYKRISYVALDGKIEIWCPLIEVPTPHGRLIDADFEEQHYTSMTTNPTPDVTEQDRRNSLIIIEALQMAKTVIEAEE